MFKIRNAPLALLSGMVLGMTASEMSAQPAGSTKQFIYVLRLVPRLHDPKAWTDRDNASVAAHFKRLQEATAQRKVILAGRTDEPPSVTFGLVIFEARDQTEAKAFMEADPTVIDGVMVAQLHPYSVALMRK